MFITPRLALAIALRSGPELDAMSARTKEASIARRESTLRLALAVNAMRREIAAMDATISVTTFSDLATTAILALDKISALLELAKTELLTFARPLERLLLNLPPETH